MPKPFAIYNLMSVVQLLLVLMVLWGSLQSAVAHQASFSRLVVFGDSLSDTGNLAVVDFPPPYFDNRISDGPVIADLIGEAIGSSALASGHLLGRTDGFNYAVGGGNIDGGDPEDLPQQISAYLQRVNNQADPDALYFVFVGGNDLRGLRGTTSLQQAQLQLERILGTLHTQLERLRGAGARAFLIPNVANIARLPETLDLEASEPGVTARAESYTRLYNDALAQMLDGFANQASVTVSAFDLFQSFENLIVNASQLGFRNVRQGCFDPDELRIATECLLFGFDVRVFFDRIHPSSASNQLIGTQLLASLPALPPVAEEQTIILAPVLDLLLQ